MLVKSIQDLTTGAPRAANRPIPLAPEMGSQRRMTTIAAVRWWPPVGLLAMLVLGWAVGNGSTALDDWFLHDVRHTVGKRAGWLLTFTEVWLLGPVLAVCVAVALYRRRWRLAAVTLALPLAAVEINALLKRLFERYKGDTLAYPSGHTTLMVTVLGMVVLSIGWRLWTVAVAVAASLLGMTGLACTYHYFTDTVGSALFATALVCMAARFMPDRR